MIELLSNKNWKFKAISNTNDTIKHSILLTKSLENTKYEITNMSMTISIPKKISIFRLIFEKVEFYFSFFFFGFIHSLLFIIH